VSLSSGRSLTLVRRDLFDARFQLISEDGKTAENNPDVSEQTQPTSASALEFIEAPSDLVPGVYEGGLKTWECSIDLVNYLDGLEDGSIQRDIHGKRILEVASSLLRREFRLIGHQIGCGTAVPSLYLLHRLFSSPISTRETQLHLQDFNDSVLEFVSFPNILITWCTYPCIIMLPCPSSQ
jgi:protein-histidine N-methyltransferase